jgi:hypothetical protein
VDPGKELNWFIAFAATLVAAALAVAGGVWLFHYQDRETEEKLERKLAMRVAVESQMNLWLLESKPTMHVDARTKAEFGEPVVLVRLSTVAHTDLMRSNLLEPVDAMRLMDLEGTINAHNSQMEVLLSTRRSGGSGHDFRTLTSDLAQRQENLRESFKMMVQALREQGIEAPDYDQAVVGTARDREHE